MKKVICLIVLGLFLGACASATQSELWKHDTMYKNYGHLKYSWCGYKDCGPSYTKDSKEQGWWGISIKQCKNVK